MENFNRKIQTQFKEMCKTGKLFRSTLTGRDVWDLYLKSFKSGDDPTFRDPESSVHNCNHCNNFIRRYGNILAINDKNEVITLFDFKIDGEYSDVTKVLSKTLKSSKISEIFMETFNSLQELPYEKCSKSNDVFRLGIERNSKRYTKEEAEQFGVVKTNEIRTFNHFFLDLDKSFVNMASDSIESIQAGYRSAKEVFKRGLDEISFDTLNLVRDLINQGSLLNGDTHLFKIETFIQLKEVYDKLPIKERDNWCWVNSYNLPIAKFKNELIGVLCSELSEGEELNKACLSWNKRVDPSNYMKATAPITKRQIVDAQNFVEENGYVESFTRRFATKDDINVSEIKHINSGDGSIKSASLFDGVKVTNTRHKRNEFKDIEEVSIDKFMKDILPTCTSVEAYLENRHDGNLMTLTTSDNDESKKMFKWDNNYSWSFNGNLAGKSEIKESVSSRGGKVDGVLRFSIKWSDGENTSDNSDLDAWCQLPSRFKIGYSSALDRSSGGNLDIDIMNPHNHSSKDIVENITFPNLNKMSDGVYKFWVNQFSNRGSKGFKAEIEFNGEIYNYVYNKNVSGDVQVATVTLKDGKFTIEHHLPETNSSKELYGLETKQFHRVNLMCLSPNHWGGNKIGNKHYFFILDGCKVNTSVRSFHNENLLPDLAKHRKVLEVLGRTNMIKPSKNQLSGLGFNSTVKDEVVLKLGGNFKRTVKVKF